ncbi:uncharacterized protein LOC100574948 [Acyrthosiphon pisum]|uniref:ACYPI46564 protein n=1 Tax=Acyrthosiphon pisum TaxID=7029 RepID=C4WUN0_ACYPI|nr:uncharacterized protein LOC100574948 [Acyrthosiphon pisum]BAH71600.1 ACYPI46564 [Acyrthosiphon pisum]|eukprot:NP_001233095.1 uncharacterized protein LOC100574948 [Acyrthosiphon pisum]
MFSKQLWRSFAARNKIVNGLLKHNEKKTQSSSIVTRNASNRNSDIDAELNKPVKYTTSPAHDWKAQHSRIGSKAEFGPWYEPHAVSASLILFMIYFFILREENDLDLLLDKPLSETLKKE